MCKDKPNSYTNTNRGTQPRVGDAQPSKPYIAAGKNKEERQLNEAFDKSEVILLKNNGKLDFHQLAISSLLDDGEYAQPIKKSFPEIAAQVALKGGFENISINEVSEILSKNLKSANVNTQDREGILQNLMMTSNSQYTPMNFNPNSPKKEQKQEGTSKAPTSTGMPKEITNPLVQAIKDGKLNEVKEIMESESNKGINFHSKIPNMTTGTKETALEKALKNKKYDIAAYLVSKGANLDDIELNDGQKRPFGEALKKIIQESEEVKEKLSKVDPSKIENIVGKDITKEIAIAIDPAQMYAKVKKNRKQQPQKSEYATIDEKSAETIEAAIKALQSTSPNGPTYEVVDISPGNALYDTIEEALPEEALPKAPKPTYMTKKDGKWVEAPISQKELFQQTNTSTNVAEPPKEKTPISLPKEPSIWKILITGGKATDQYNEELTKIGQELGQPSIKKPSLWERIKTFGKATDEYNHQLDELRNKISSANQGSVYEKLKPSTNPIAPTDPTYSKLTKRDNNIYSHLASSTNQGAVYEKLKPSANPTALNDPTYSKLAKRDNNIYSHLASSTPSNGEINPYDKLTPNFKLTKNPLYKSVDLTDSIKASPTPQQAKQDNSKSK